MKVELISIIIPVYQAINYLDRCLESVVNQTYKNLQIILVDDGSSDGSGEKCESWKEKDSRIEVYHQTNKGVAAARNLGLKHAKGEYIGFIDPDDYVNIYMYEHLLKAIIRENTEIAICKVYEVDEKRSRNINEKLLGNVKRISCKEWEEGLINNIFDYYVCDKLYKRENIPEKFQLFKICEDVAFIHELEKKVENVVYIEEELYYYYKHADSLMGFGKFIDISALYADQFCIDLLVKENNIKFLKHRLRLTSAHAIHMYYDRKSMQRSLDELCIIKSWMKKVYREHFMKFRLVDHLKLILFFIGINPYKFIV